MFRSQAFVQEATVAGYFLPISDSANSSSACSAASTVGAV
jgi:hypothetical protein